ncbi:hypothetical protein GOP47_0013490 [Adiantum capillus-veneris]|uniref:Uncharacterized protein n=1 Tax=Adiantum capillus-veneris TaxID=13818 RepID=A0A9D4UNM1_ADICA|nr:hypothetical protein GOP47_0013490 [Adiantum capillus-veneris]
MGALALSLVVAILCLGMGVSATSIHVVNNAARTICAKYWVPNQIGGGCRELKPAQAWDLGTSGAWVAATMWAIEGSCAGQPCNTGPPAGVSQFEFTINGFSNFDYYDLSIRSGFNMGISVGPTNPACPSQFCRAQNQCDGMLPNGPDRTKSCASGSTDYVITYN